MLGYIFVQLSGYRAVLCRAKSSLGPSKVLYEWVIIKYMSRLFTEKGTACMSPGMNRSKVANFMEATDSIDSSSTN